MPAKPARSALAVFIAAASVTAALVVYSRTAAFAWDEGYHLVAAFLIAHGKRPYLDFVFPQTPLNAYWNAGLLRIFGENWRVTHTAAALLTSGAVAMASFQVYRRLNASRAWRASAAIATAVIMGLNTAVFEFGALQAYGMCLFMIVAAYTVTTDSVDRPGLLYPLLGGLCGGIAADSSLLTAPVGPVLLIWMLIVNRTGSVAKKCVAFCVGVAAAFVPLLLLLVKSPHQVIFGFLQYQLLFRSVEWGDAGIHNLGEVLSFADSSQAVLLVLLAAGGILFAWKNAPPNLTYGPGADAETPDTETPDFAERAVRALRAEIYLCGCLAILLTAHLLTARPTFTRYFLFTVPFLAIAAAYGLFEIAGRLTSQPRPWLASGVLCAVTIYGLAASLFEQRDDMMWKDLEQAAAKVREVTPPDAVLLADEAVYFLLRRTPPTGMELEDSHKLTFSDAEAAAVHVIPRPKLDLMIKAGRFETVEMCDDDEIDRIGLAGLYSKSATVGTCQVFWKWGKPAEE